MGEVAAPPSFIETMGPEVVGLLLLLLVFDDDLGVVQKNLGRSGNFQKSTCKSL
jgi:hypothetical protein